MLVTQLHKLQRGRRLLTAGEWVSGLLPTRPQTCLIVLGADVTSAANGAAAPTLFRNADTYEISWQHKLPSNTVRDRKLRCGASGRHSVLAILSDKWFAYTSLGEWFRFRTYMDVVLSVPNFYVTLSLELLQVLMMRIFTTQSWPVGWAGKPVKMGRNNLRHRSSFNRCGLSHSLLQMRSKNKSSVLSFIMSVYVRSFTKRRTKQKLRNPLAIRCLASIQCSSNYINRTHTHHTIVLILQ